MVLSLVVLIEELSEVLMISLYLSVRFREKLKKTESRLQSRVNGVRLSAPQQAHGSTGKGKCAP